MSSSLPVPFLSSSSSSIVMQPDKQQKSRFMLVTESTNVQQETEVEVEPFFVDLKSFTQSQLDHLRATGMLEQQSAAAAAAAATTATATTGAPDDPLAEAPTSEHQQHQQPKQQDHSLDICLMREKHAAYVRQVWAPPQPSLKSHFCCLDASRTWMIYWTLHAHDLLFVQSDTTTAEQQQQPNESSSNKNSRLLELDAETCDRIVETIRQCWTECEEGSTHFPESVVESDPILREIALEQQQQQQTSNDSSDDEDDDINFVGAGGFGGGPYQMPHAATNYAAVLSLCIVASIQHQMLLQQEEQIREQASINTASTHPPPSSSSALDLLRRVRKPMYIWFASLQDQDHGGYRMHHDGEIDVRASYCILAIAQLLGLLTKTSTATTTIQQQLHPCSSSSFLCHPRAMDFLAKCQTFEGGFGGEPFSEAHGGYTFCATAALYFMMSSNNYHSHNNNKTSLSSPSLLLCLEDLVDVPALLGWLVRRQMSFEGGFNGRANKLVDGCYSFWQGGANAIVSHLVWRRLRQSVAAKKNTQQRETVSTTTVDDPMPVDNNDEDADKKKYQPNQSNEYYDPWLEEDDDKSSKNQDNNGEKNDNDEKDNLHDDILLFDEGMLERYILLCAQDVHGGLRDKPSKARDFYHSCYNLSGLSVAQHYGRNQQQQQNGSSSSKSNRRNSNKIPAFGHPQLSLVTKTHPVFNIRIDRVRYIRDCFQKNNDS